MSADPLFSAHWHRVKNVRPKLAADVTIVRQTYRSKPYWVLHRRATNAYYRLDIASYELIDQLDGKRSIDDVWNHVLVARPKGAPGQDDFLGVLAALQTAELLTIDRRVSADSLFERREETRVRRRRQRWLNPLFIRFSLHDPDAFLTKLTPLANAVFSRVAFYLWAILMLAGLIALILSGASILETLSTPGYPSSYHVMLLLLVYPPLKLLHEFGHALAIKRGGGEVHDVGISLMVLMPLPYVDASASAAFPLKLDRMIVAAAGIFVELAIAAIGVLLWATSAGIVADIGLALLLVGGFSTLLINGNPLLRFDGYYLLSDALEIPNLGTRARAALVSAFKSMISGKQDPLGQTDDVKERYWLISYGFFSLVYRALLMLWIAWWLSGRYLIFGVALALYAVTKTFIIPLLKGFRALVQQPELHSTRPVLLLSVIPMIFTAALVWLPLPHAHVSKGVVWLPDNAVVRIQSSCMVMSTSVEQGQEVEPGQPLFDCVDPELALQESQLIARSDELNALSSGLAIKNPAEFRRLETEREANDRELEQLQERIEAGFHSAELQGLFDVPGNVSLEGRAFARGDIAAFVVPEEHRTVRVALNQSVARRLDAGVNRIELFADSEENKSKVYATSIVAKTPRASLDIPSAALSTVGGGDHLADPQGDGRLVLEPVFNIELEWPVRAGVAPVGAHVPVRFVHTPEPLAGRIANAIRRVFSERERA